MRLSLTALPGIPLVTPGDELAALILEAAARAQLSFEPGDVLVLAQKVVSKAEGRHVDLAEVTPSERAVELAGRAEKDPRLVEVILWDARQVLRVRPGVIIVVHRLGFVCANAGIDHSNVGGDNLVLRLPEDPDRSAARLRQALEERTGVRLGVVIIDSHGRAWRMGTEGVAIGLSGLPALMDLRGWPDLFGDPLLVTQVGVADELAAAASLLMGQAAEGRPVIHVRGMPYELREGSVRELLRPEAEDLFR